jgi:hypothetical protein
VEDGGDGDDGGKVMEFADEMECLSSETFSRLVRSSDKRIKMSKAIRPEHLKLLRPLEAELKQAVKLQEAQAAEVAMKAIQKLLIPYGANHYRLLECRLWYFESQFDANHITNAESGFQGIATRAREGTRLSLEALFFLGLCYLRQKRIPDAKTKFRLVFAKLNEITSSDTNSSL